MKNFLLILFVSITFISCAQVEKRGYAFELSDYQDLKEDIHDKQDVLNAMGTPTFISDIDQNDLWVYYHEEWKKRLFFKPDITERKVMAISFNDRNVIKKIENYDLSDENYVGFSQKYTKVASPQKGWLQDIFGNIGQVKASQ